MSGARWAWPGLCLAALFAACGGPTDSTGDVDIGDTAQATSPMVDVESDTVDEVTGDTAGETTTPPRPLAGEQVTLTRSDGGLVGGELVAIYDHRDYWLEPEDTETWAIFDPTGLASTTADDTSLVFVDGRDIESLTHGPLPVGTIRYRDALRTAGIVMRAVPLDEKAYVITAGTGYHLKEWGYGHFAWDFGLTDAQERTWSPPGTANSDYHVWDAPLFSPVAGVVAEVVRDAPDNPVSLDEVPFGSTHNLVGIRVFGNYYVYLLHQRQGTIGEALAVGATVRVADPLGRVGNSGVSQAPHLHLVLLWFDATHGRSWSVPAEFSDVYAGTSQEGSGLAGFASPGTGEWVSNSPF